MSMMFLEIDVLIKYLLENMVEEGFTTNLKSEEDNKVRV